MERLQVFQERLLLARRRREMSQEALAEHAKLFKTDISKYERGQSQPNLTRLCRLATVLDVSTDYLLGLTDDPSPRSECAPARARLTPGLWKGQVWMAPDFDDTDEELISLFEGEDNDAAS